jgi:hypothetical protein
MTLKGINVNINIEININIYFSREEYLYNILLDLMRSPETLHKLTKSCTEKFREKLRNQRIVNALNEK